MDGASAREFSNKESTAGQYTRSTLKSGRILPNAEDIESRSGFLLKELLFKSRGLFKGTLRKLRLLGHLDSWNEEYI